jgi:2-polyprenyl-3-methyl-5-hydroxy-6-metoxy-1,4-benzoquinol methylase
MTAQWDNNAARRHKQIIEGLDFSFDNVLSPTFIKLLKGIKNIGSKKVLDVGCGSGILTYRLSKYTGNIIGIDPSIKSIKIAEREYEKIRNLQFICSSVEDYRNKEVFDVVISNMTIQAIKDIKKAFCSISKLMNKSSIFIFSIPHPCFWIEYRTKIGLDEYKNYKYFKTSKYQITFSISNDRKPLPSQVPLYHRQIALYSKQLSAAGFLITSLLEPFPKIINNANTNWDTPHFLVFVCSKSNSSGE